MKEEVNILKYTFFIKLKFMKLQFLFYLYIKILFIVNILLEKLMCLIRLAPNNIMLNLFMEHLMLIINKFP